VEVRGLPEELDNLTAQQKLHVAQFVLTQIEAGIRRESIDFVGTKDFKPHALKDLFIDKTLKLRLEGETGLGWKDSKIPGLDQIDLASKPWHVFEDSFGTDQEKLFIRHLNDHAQRLNELYEEFYLIRNEKALTLYSFKDGQAFEPDFLLFLRKTKEAKATIYQLFIEPKGTKFWPDDQWKEDFLKTIEQEARLETVFQDKEYKVYGLPFFNDEPALKATFEDALTKCLGT
jgi:type III restriction enzyme